MPREIITDWGGPGSGGKVSVMFFDTTADAGDQRAALADLWTSVDNHLDNAVTWSIRQSGRELANATGTLTGEWTDTPSLAGTGALVGQATADSTQVLLRWGTGVVVGGRFLKGHTFVPGLESNGFTDGNLSSAVQATMNTAAAAMAASGIGFGIWHRPQGGSGGSFHPVNSGQVWAEAAVLRGRRG